MLGNKRLIHTINIKNLLSFGPNTGELGLESLNVLIGPNASGKSNVIEALDLLQATADDLTEPIRGGGGINEWLWKGKGIGKTPTAELEVTVNNHSPLRHRLHHRLAFSMVGQRLELVDEAIENERPDLPDTASVPFFYRFQNGRPLLNVRRSTDYAGNGNENNEPYFTRSLRREDLAPDQSVLSQRKDPDQYPELTHLGQQYRRFKLYREWNLGHNASLRLPQQTDLPNDFLLEDASNLALVLNDLEDRLGLHTILLEKLQEFHDKFTRISGHIRGGTVQIFLEEKGLRQPIPASRLSNGTLRYLCLLAILCHPEPPPLVAIEEPELGLHPDILPGLAQLLVEASHRTQLVITTHSDILVDALSDTPEAVIVCEKENGATTLRRLDRKRLSIWLESYSLGELWRRGEIGGNRW
ncbi:MAG: AAA family ATPase [Chloroflexota bacterium]